MFSPPTDKITKFICVLGLLLITSSIGLLIKATDDFDSHVAIFVPKINELRAASFKYFNKVNEAKKIIKDEGGLNSKGTKEQHAKIEKIFRESNPLEIKANEIAQQLEIPTFVFQQRLDRYSFIKLITIGGIVLGFLMFIFGLYFWYRNDKALRKS